MQVQVLVQLVQAPQEAVLHTQVPEDHKLLHLHSEVVQLVQVEHIQHPQLATNHRVHLLAPTIQEHQLQAQATQVKVQQVQLATNHQVHLNKDHTQALVPPFHLPTCHHLTNLHKVSLPSLIHHTQHLARHKRQPENICHQDEDKLTQARERFAKVYSCSQVILTTTNINDR